MFTRRSCNVKGTHRCRTISIIGISDRQTNPNTYRRRKSVRYAQRPWYPPGQIRRERNHRHACADTETFERLMEYEYHEQDFPVIAGDTEVES
jgi:hypothetical protein